MAKQKQNKNELRMLIRKQMAEINRRVSEYVDELKGKINLSDFLTTQFNVFRELTGTKSKKHRIYTGNLSKMSYASLNDIIEQQDVFLKSKYSTKESRAETERKRRATLREKGYDLTENQFDFFVDMINNDSVSQLVADRVYTSGQILDIVSSADEYYLSHFLDKIRVMSSELNTAKIPASEKYVAIELLQLYPTAQEMRDSELFKKYSF